jgi:hypothetical protein
MIPAEYTYCGYFIGSGKKQYDPLTNESPEISYIVIPSQNDSGKVI